MAKAGKSSELTARSGPPLDTSYRVIGADGIERSMSNLSDWIVAIRSGAVGCGCLFLDIETQRWRPVSDLDIFAEAKQAVVKKASEAGSRSESSKVESDSSAIQGSGSGSEGLETRARSSTLLWALLAAAVLIALAAWTAGSALLVAIHNFIRQAPEPVRIGGAAVLFVILAEEFYWFSLKMVGVGSTKLIRRIALQALSLLTSCVLLYAAFAFSSTESFQPNVRFFVKNVAIIGGVYATSLFLWSILLLPGTDVTTARKALASIVVSVMLAGTFYMAVAPAVQHEAQTDKTFRMQDRR